MNNDHDNELDTDRERGEIVIEEESLREDYTKVPNTILRRADISPGAKLTYVMLLSYAHKQDRCFPGQQRLAEDIGAGVRSVVRYLKELVTLCLLRVKRRGLGKTNVYYLTRWSKPQLSGEADRESDPEAEVTSRGGDANLALPKMPDRQREKNKREKDKSQNAVETNSLEERGARNEWTAISSVVREHWPQVTEYPDRELWLAQEILAQTGDDHSVDLNRPRFPGHRADGNQAATSAANAARTAAGVWWPWRSMSHSVL